jgi:prepilin-type N-terminal cleavage/methylation domain-containing protein
MRRQLRATSTDAGFGLIELIVAMSILAVVMTGIAYGIISELTLTADSRGREVGANLASQAIDAARSVSDLSILNATASTQTVNGVVYTVLRTVTDYSAGAASPCDGSQVQAIVYKRVSIRVTWPNMVAQPVVASTLLAPSAASFSPTRGNIGVKVVDADSLPVYGALVNISSGTSSYSTYTDGQGCAFFDSLLPASYTVTASNTGYVAPNGSTSPSETSVVNSGATTRVAFSLDKAAGITVNMPAGTYLPPQTVPVALGNSSLLPAGSVVMPGSGPTRLVGNLYPFLSGYTVWAGSCSDADPEGQIMVNGVNTGPYYPGASRGPAVSVTSGSATTGLVMAQVTATVLTSAGVAVVGAQVLATHTAANGSTDQGCPVPESWTIGTTNANGQAFASLPWGDWQFSATGATAPVTKVLAPATTPYAVSLATP